MNKELERKLERELRNSTKKELYGAYDYYKPRAKELGKDEYKYLILMEREINKRELKKKMEIKNEKL